MQWVSVVAIFPLVKVSHLSWYRHIHVSLRDSNGKNSFALSEDELKTGRTGAAYDDTKFISQEGEWFLAGILDGIADGALCIVTLIILLPTFLHQWCQWLAPPQCPSRFSQFLQLVPTINGYKRLVGGEAFWAPNAITYGYDSRAASIRIISPPSVPPAATRLEIRIPGADMNAYFALSAIFLLGLRGIDKKLKLSVQPMSQLTTEDKQNGKVRIMMDFIWDMSWHILM